MNGTRRPNGQSVLNDSAHPLHLRPDRKNFARVAAMIVSFILMGLALGGAGQFLLQMLDKGVMQIDLERLVIRLTLYGLLLLLSLGVSWLGKREDVGNLLIPVMYDVYKLAVSSALVYLYYEIIKRLVKQVYDVPRFLIYVGLLVGSVLLLVILNRFSQTKRLRWHGGVILTMSMVHLLVMFVFYSVEPSPRIDYFAADLIILVLMIASGVLMILPNRLARITPGKPATRNVWRANQRQPPGSSA